MEYRCTDLKRADAVRGRPDLNGIDFLEVSDSQLVLHVHLLNPLSGTLDAGNIRIEGGERVRDFQVTDVQNPSPNLLEVTVDRPGDFSTYTFRLAGGPATTLPPTGFDRVLSAVEFSFKVGCPSDFDCRPAAPPAPEAYPEPVIDYLAKDYASFRRLMFDRLSVTVPRWAERNPADVGVALVEAIAYTADHLSYFQDSVGTEAYLGTARLRTSVRRHARLLGYRMHEGVNARAWVQVQVSADNVPLAKGTPLFTRVEGMAGRVPPGDIPSDVEVFETLHDAHLFVGQNEIAIHTWTDTGCTLLEGATQATLKDDNLNLKPGDVLIFEDPDGCQAVRLQWVSPDTDPVGNMKVVDVGWVPDDALARGFDVGQTKVRGNIVLADHGRTLTGGQLQDVTYAAPYDAAAPASRSLTEDPRTALPAVTLTEPSPSTAVWVPRFDLLASGRFDHHFVLEGDALRFGDGIHGERPTVALTPRWRQGNGSAGNIGTGAIYHVVSSDSGVVNARNPMPAQGGMEAESLEEVRQYAPQAFRTQERAVTEADYAEMAQRHPEVQRAAATLRWTGSWYTVFVTVDRKHGLPVDSAFESELSNFLDHYRLAGYDVEIEPPSFVSLDILFKVCVAPGFFRGHVKQALFEAFRPVFDPDNWTFGQTVYLGPLIATAMRVPGVLWVETLSFGPRAVGDEIRLGRLEIARLDNDPDFPEHGKIDFEMEGGL